MKNISIKKVYFEDLDKLKKLLLPPNLGYVPWEKWQRTFERNQYHFDDPYIGLAMETEGEYVGFVGAVRSYREIRGEKHEVSNLTSFVVTQEFRGEGARLIRAIKEHKNGIYTILTPVRVTQLLLARVHGAFIQSEYYQIIAPKIAESAVYEISERNIILQNLSGENLQIYEEHSVEVCTPLLLTDGFKNCLLLLTDIELKGKVYVEVLYYSDQAFFTQYIAGIGALVKERFNGKTLVVDVFDTPETLLDTNKQIKMPLPRMVFSADGEKVEVPFISIFSERTKMGL